MINIMSLLQLSLLKRFFLSVVQVTNLFSTEKHNPAMLEALYFTTLHKNVVRQKQITLYST